MAQSQHPFPALSILAVTLIATTVSGGDATATSPPDLQQEQLDKIIDALVGAGDFTNWADLLSSSAPSDFPFSATFFVPADSSGGGASSILNPFVFAYHIVPQRLSFSELLLFKNHARLPTLLANKSILITRNSSRNFTLDGTRLTRPDLYSSASVAVHAVAALLDYRLYGDPADASFRPARPLRLPPPPPDSAADGPPPAAAPPVIAIYDDEYFTGGARSLAPALVFLIGALFLSSVS